MRARAPLGEGYGRLKALTRELDLHTVCEGAHCPNLGECWNRGTATFMIMGAVCTRACRFCAVPAGRPAALDVDEPRHVAEAVARMNLRHAVVTSVTRDDLPDGGAAHFAATIAAIRARHERCQVEVLIPDLRGDPEALRVVFAARPDVLNHNIETVPRLYGEVRPAARYPRSLAVLEQARRAGLLVKSGLMVGLGETEAELLATLSDMRAVGTTIVTIGQYLQPMLSRLSIVRYYSPEEFAALRLQALGLGFHHVEAGPLVRSSYHADEQVRSACESAVNRAVSS
ncbi:MAG: lipoyl synthase [Vicinamibacteria bacterium]|nr:lipoyl synthase [Vicinamibacteria bacterium]